MIDRELLWKAWPDGYLARRGVSTVGGWLYDGFRWRKQSTNVEGAYLRQTPPEPGEIRSGDLLPAVDPADTATWATLLLDLADARGWTGGDSSPVVTGLTWVDVRDHGVTSWVLRVHFGLHWDHHRGRHVVHETYTFGSTRDSDMEIYDPTLALVRARIQCRRHWGA